jgi:hypothetical protein
MAAEARDMTAAELELHLDTESERVMRWRIGELERAGYAAATARELAERTYVDLHTATNLLRGGCSPDMAVRILI